jgi:hypothetical protein
LYENIRKIRGVGGTEYVYEKHVDRIQLGVKGLTQFKIQVGDSVFLSYNKQVHRKILDHGDKKG